MRFGLRELIMLLVLVAVPVSSYWLVFRPQNHQITLARGEVQHKQSLLEQLRQETARNADLERANAEMKANIAVIEARLPSNKEVDSIVRQVTDLAVQCGLDAPAIKSGKPVKAALYMEQPLEMKTSGDFNGFYQFMTKLEQLPRITRVPDMKLSRSDKTNGVMTAEFTLSIYFQDEHEQTPTPTPAAGTK
jgi:Tfp pilus assembly protein PilO